MTTSKGISGGRKTWALLAHDFLRSLDPWPEDGHVRLQSWHDHVFVPHSETAYVVSETLVEQLGGYQDIESKRRLSIEFVTTLGEPFASQCQSLLTTLLQEIPLETAVAIWQPWFGRVNLRNKNGSGIGWRIGFLVWFKEVEMAQSTGNLDPQAVLGHLDIWQKQRRDLEPQDAEWAAQRLLCLLGTVDLSSAQDLQNVMRKSLQVYSRPEHNSRLAAVETVLGRFPGDSVGQVLLLVVLGQRGMTLLDQPDGEWLADIVSGVTAQFSSSIREAFWQLLADRAVQSSPPATEAYQRFRRMTAAQQGVGDIVRAIRGLFRSRKTSG